MKTKTMIYDVKNYLNDRIVMSNLVGFKSEVGKVALSQHFPTESLSLYTSNEILEVIEIMDFDTHLRAGFNMLFLYGLNEKLAAQFAIIFGESYRIASRKIYNNFSVEEFKDAMETYFWPIVEND